MRKLSKYYILWFREGYLYEMPQDNSRGGDDAGGDGD
jgi:hypothetical protein